MRLGLHFAPSVGLHFAPSVGGFAAAFCSFLKLRTLISESVSITSATERYEPTRPVWTPVAKFSTSTGSRRPCRRSFCRPSQARTPGYVSGPRRHRHKSAIQAYTSDSSSNQQNASRGQRQRLSVDGVAAAASGLAEAGGQTVTSSDGPGLDSWVSTIEAPAHLDTPTELRVR
jgi:hypothetical protein